MRILNIISHPFTLIVSFFLIMVSGQQPDQIYGVHLFAGLPSGAGYSITGVIGISIILFSHFCYAEGDKSMDAYVTNLLGVVMLVISLFLFFYSNQASYAGEALNHGIFIASMMFFCIFVTCFIVIL